MTTLMITLTTSPLTSTKINISYYTTLMIVFTLMYMNPNTNIINSLMIQDNLSLMLSLLTIITMMLTLTASIPTPDKAKYTTMFMMFLMTLFSSSNMLMFYLMFELTMIPIFTMILHKGTQKERLQASYYILIYTIASSLPLLMLIINSKTPDFLMTHTTDQKIQLPLLFILAFLVKSPMFLTHLWLPKAHVEAPMEGSMILAAVLLSMGGFGILRLSHAIEKNMKTITPIITSISMIGATMTSWSCLRQKDMKALIAYSSVAHMAIMLSSIMMFNNFSYKSTTMTMISHGLTSSAMFMIITLIYMKKHSRNIILSKGLLNTNPATNKWLFIILMSNMSVPPLLNIISEVLSMSTLMKKSFTMPLLMIPSMIMTSTFSLLLYANLSHNQPNQTPISTPLYTKHTSILMMHILPLLLLSLKSETMTMSYTSLKHYPVAMKIL